MGKLLHHEEMNCPKCAQPRNTMNMEVGESLVANHNCSKAILVSVSIQG